MLFDDLSIEGRKIVHLGLATPSGAIYTGSAQGATATDESTGSAQISYSLQYSGVTNTTVPVNYGTYTAVAGVDTNTTPYFGVVGTNAARLYTNSAVLSSSYTIERKSVTITGVGVADKIYNGTTSATITGTPVINGKVPGDSVTVAGGTANFSTADAGLVKLATITGYNLTGTAASNYLLTGVPISASAEISQKTLTVTAQAKTKVYGDNDPALTYNKSGLVGSDMISGSLERVIGEDAGPYPIGLGTLSAGPNYSIAYTPADLTITAKELTITADPQSKTYGDMDPALTYSSSGLVGGDTISGSLERVVDENVGAHAILLGSLTAGSNYSIVYVGADLTIGAATLGIAADPQFKSYNDPDPTLTYLVTGLVNGDTEAGVITGALDRILGEGVGFYAINQGTLDAGPNYVISFTGADLTINPASVPPGSIILTEPPAGLTYDGSPKEYGVSSAGPSSFVILYTGRGNPYYNVNPPTDAGDYTVMVTVSDVNYDNTAFETLDFTIAKAEVIATAETKTRVYGAPNPALTISYSGFANGEDESVLDSLPIASCVASDSDPVGGYSITLSGGSDNNYEFTLVDGSLVIEPASAAGLFSIILPANLVYDGSPKVCAVNSSGPSHFVVTYINSLGGGDTNAPTLAGVYSVRADVTDTNFHTISVTETMTIAKASQTINFPGLSNGTMGASLTLSATSSSGLPVTYSSSDTSVATVTGNTLNYVGIGLVTITASQAGDDNYETASDESQTFSVLSADTPWDTWGDDFSMLSGADRAPTADPDGDGFSNAQEFAFGTDPLTKTAEIFSAISDGSNYVVTFKKRKLASDANYEFRSSTDLTQAFSAGTLLTPGGATSVDAHYEQVSVTLPLSGDRGFIRGQANVLVNPSR